MLHLSPIKKFSSKIWLVNDILLLCLVTAFPTQAQIIPDATLPVNSTVTPSGNTTIIEGGTTAGSNLFHSFREFSIPTGSEAFFNNAVDIQHIFSRVTGGNISNIDGLIRANGTANLFLLNPNGIIFGPNARLNIGGSFLASTANSLRFSDGTFFSTNPSQTTPLLTISVPIGLQFGSTPGKIVNRSRATNSNGFPAGLQVKPGQTLALVGGDLLLDGGGVAAFGGRIELGSVAGNSLVSLTPTAQGFVLGYDGVQNFQDIQIQQAPVNASGEGGGKIQIQGRRVTLTDGATVGAVTLGAEPGGTVTVRASDSLELSGFGNIGDSQSSTSLLASTLSTGSAGNVTIETGQLILRDGALVSAGTQSQGKGGTVSVNAALVELSGTSPDGSPSALTALTLGAGDAGTVTIDTRQLIVRDGAFVAASTFNRGKAGSVSVNASESVELSGTAPDGSPSILTAATFSTGDAGDVTIQTGRLSLSNGAWVAAGSLSEGNGTGNAGNVSVNASKSVELSGISPNGQTLSTVTAATLGSGNAGNVRIQTRQLMVQDGAQLSAVTFSTGKAGNVSVTASDLVELSGTSPNEQLPIPSVLAATTLGAGDGGKVTVDTRRLIVRDGAQLGATTASVGNAGTVNVTASESVELIGTSKLAFQEFPSNLTQLIASVTLPNGQSPSIIGAATFGTGNAGEITIKTGRLSVRDGAGVVAGTRGVGAGGNITVKASSVELSGTSSDGQSSSTLTTEASGAGNAGNVTVETERFLIQNGGEIGASSKQSGNPGDINIIAGDLRLFNQASLNAESATGKGGNIRLQARNIQLRRQSQISATSAPGATEGNIDINTQTLVLLEGSQIRTNSVAPNGGSNIRILPLDGLDLAVFKSPDSIINASGQLTIEGDIQPAPANIPQVEVVDATGLIEQRCSSARKGSSFTVTGRGGIPLSPDEPLSDEAFLVDLVTINPEERTDEGNVRSRQLAGGISRQLAGGISRSVASAVSQLPSEIVEATGWYTNEKGQVVLNASTPTPYRLWQTQPLCK